MGSCASLGNPASKYKFKYGRPTMYGHSIYPMFNGLLYRIIDKNLKQWAFYNDTRDLIIHVGILFDYDSQIVPLAATSAVRIDDPQEGHEDDFGKYLCEVDIYPADTVLFISGLPTGWSVDTLEARDSIGNTHFRL
ncbi:unnamed protein product [Phytomonas sp. Hart1]|nr:unnamed protein product [Phytomonas sp. Hart1]|eukprot:CCW66392.1 unnamed protein product [Phytomonas sp. isolate Hart1]